MGGRYNNLRIVSRGGMWY